MLFGGMAVPIVGIFLSWFGMQIFMEKPITVKEYVQSFSMEEYITSAGNAFLREAVKGETIPYEAYLPEEELTVSLTHIPTKDHRVEILVGNEDYERCLEQARNGLESAVIDLITIRLRSAGINQVDVQELFKQVYGISISEYLDQYGPKLMPSKQEITGLYQGELQEIEVSKEAVALDLFSPMIAYAEDEKAMPANLALKVGSTEYLVKAMNVAYQGNYYVSLRDVAAALIDSEHPLDVSISSEEIGIYTDVAYSKIGGENEPFSSEKTKAGYMVSLEPGRYNLTLNGEKKIIYTIKQKGNNGYECYISLSDLTLLTGIDFQVEGNLITLLKEPFSFDEESLKELKENGYFSVVSSALLGLSGNKDGILFSENEMVPVEMASITKLMSILVAMDAISEGKITREDLAVVSRKAAELSVSDDGVIALSEGTKISVETLMEAALLASSNECTLVLAELIAGSEEAFVKQMMTKASEIGMSEQTIFYNCHGLPVYSDTLLTAKLQNKTTARDCYQLVRYLFTCYPQVIDITSKQSMELSGLGVTVNNTNPLLYNVEGCVGLKTGTTNQAGYCLVSVVKLWQDGSFTKLGEGDTFLIAMEFGAEDPTTRGRVSQVLLEAGKELLQSSKETIEDENQIPDSLEMVIWKLIQFQLEG